MNAWLGRLGFVIVLGSLFWLLSPSLANMHGQTAYSQNASSANGSDSQLQVHASTLPNGVQQILLVDSQSKSMAVYQVESITGKIQLKSVRSLVWDLQMEHFNGQAPLPSELRQAQP